MGEPPQGWMSGLDVSDIFPGIISRRFARIGMKIYVFHRTKTLENKRSRD